jgi:hypothetical protein
VDENTMTKVADAVKGLSATSGKAIEAATNFGRVIKGPVEELVGIVEDRVKFASGQPGGVDAVELPRDA